jgi:hypothetical protein
MFIALYTVRYLLLEFLKDCTTHDFVCVINVSGKPGPCLRDMIRVNTCVLYEVTLYGAKLIDKKITNYLATLTSI